MIRKVKSSEEGYAEVTFVLSSAIWAEKASVVGDFNDWDATLHPMKRAKNGAPAHWEVTVRLKIGQRYRFRYLVNGTDWYSDSQADDSVQNEFGSYDSVLDLTDCNEKGEE